MTQLSKSNEKILNSIKTDLSYFGLGIAGSFNCKNRDFDLKKIKSILMISPREPDFWYIFVKSKEYMDGQPNPMDRWSKRVLGKIAESKKTNVYFPFDESNIWPFYTWALNCSEVNSSPVKLLVHNEKGLFLSFRGALGLKFSVEQEDKLEPICDSCHKPCLTSCPVGALGPSGYDVAKCKKYVRSEIGQNCKNGCLVRKACPYGADMRLSDQSSFHMASFLNS